MDDVLIGSEPSKKYIRTLESDIAAVKAGTKPDLALLKEKESTSAEASAISSSISVPKSIPAPNNGGFPSLDSVLAAASVGQSETVASEPAPKPAPILPAMPAPMSESEPISVPKPAPIAVEPPTPANSPLETYSGDFSERVKETGASTATIIAAEQDAAQGAPKPVSAPTHRLSGILYSIGGVVLLVAGLGGVYYVYAHYVAPSAPLILAPVITAPIFVDERQEVSGTGAILTQAIEQSLGRSLATGAVRFLYTANATSTDNSVFSALQEPAPGVLLRNINASGSMAGIVNVSGTASPFFILSVTSYSETFAGMLAWEPTMPHDLTAFFAPYPVATSTAVAGFRDEVVGNHDARVYRDPQGRSIVIYSYWDQQTLVIARNEAALTELLTRLATSRSQK